MRVLVLLATLAAVVTYPTVSANAMNTHNAVAHTAKAVTHDFRACAGRMCDGNADLVAASENVADDLKGKYPWWSGVELGKAGATIKIEAWLSYTCPGCADHWKDVWVPLIKKYGDRVSFVHQPFALPYQPFSYDATQAAFAVYRLSGNNPQVFKDYTSTFFKNQMVVYNAWDMTVSDVWNLFASWAEPFGIKRDDVIKAMNGTITTANYDAWYQARAARQRTLPGAPTFLINGWIPADLPIGGWAVSDWSKWIDANL